MSDKPGLNVATGFQGGVTVGISADTWEEFVNLSRDVWGENGQEVAEGLYAQLQAAALGGHTALAGAVQQQLGGVAAPPAQQYTAPPTAGGPPPGQTHDPRDPSKTKWIPAGISKAGKPYQGFWAAPR